jgi:hypothetical protein
MEIAQQLLQDNPRPEWVVKDVEVKRVVEAGVNNGNALPLMFF